GNCDDKGQAHPFDKIPVQKQQDRADACPVHFSDADFLSPLLHIKGGHGQDTHGGNDHGQDGEIAQDLSSAFLPFVPLFHGLVHKSQFKLYIPHQVSINCFDLLQAAFHPLGVHLDENLVRIEALGLLSYGQGRSEEHTSELQSREK